MWKRPLMIYGAERPYEKRCLFVRKFFFRHTQRYQMLDDKVHVMVKNRTFWQHEIKAVLLYHAFFFLLVAASERSRRGVTTPNICPSAPDARVCL